MRNAQNKLTIKQLTVSRPFNVNSIDVYYVQISTEEDCFWIPKHYMLYTYIYA